MSVEEKRSEVLRYCGRIACGKCVLNRRNWEHCKGREGDKCLHIATATEAELDRALELINGEPTAELEQVTEDFDTVIKINSRKKVRSIVINFEEDTSNA